MAISLSVIIPAYNEEAIINKAVSAAYTILTEAKADFEIIVINDGSIDRTGEILNRQFSSHANIIIQHKVKNEGLGSAIRWGIGLANKRYIFCVPVDSPLTIPLFDAFSSNAHRADVLVSYRKEKIGYSLRKHLNSWVFHWLVSTLFKMNLRDYNWIHLYDRKIFDVGKIEIEYNGIFMLAEILIKAKRKGFVFYEFEVEQAERLTGIATSSKWTAIIRTLGEIMHFKLHGQ